MSATVANDPGLRRLALRTLLAAFPGHEAPQWALEAIGDGLAGYVLFGFNVADATRLSALTAQLRAAAGTVLLALDEEGGDVTRLAHAQGSPYPGNAALGVVDDTALTRRIYRSIGAELAAVGVNVNLAPTVDVNTTDANPIIGTRSFGSDPSRVAAHAAAAVEGLQDAKVAACAKHFPGHGATVADSHRELPTVDVPLEVLHERDLPPFDAAVAAGCKAIMTAHIRVPALTGDAPATFSARALVGLLRERLDFTGVIVTDALEMRGAQDFAGNIPAGAVLALRSGADLLCIGARVDNALVESTAGAIVTAIESGELSLSRVEQAADRVAGLAEWTRQRVPAEPVEHDLGYLAARRAVRVEGAVDGWSDALVVQLESRPSIAVGRVPWGLGPHIAGGPADLLVVSPEQTSVEDLLAAAGGRPIVMVGRNLHRFATARSLIEATAAAHPVAVVEMGWPSAAWRPAEVRTFVTTYGASHANGRAAAELLGQTPVA